MPAPAVSTSCSRWASAGTSKSLSRIRLAGSRAPAGRCPPATMITRAKCTPSSAPKSITDPFATPSPMVASRLSTSLSAPCADRRDDRQGALVRHRRRCRPRAHAAELEREVEDLVLLPVHEPEVEARSDLADLVAHVPREERRLRVVEDDRLLAVEPARLLVDLRAHRLDAEREDLVLEVALLAVEDLALPGEGLGDPGDVVGDLRRSPIRRGPSRPRRRSGSRRPGCCGRARRARRSTDRGGRSR